MSSRDRANGLLVLVLIVGACTKDFPAAEECEKTNECYIKHTLDTMNVINNMINYWDNINVYTIIIVGVSGMIATIMIALQGDENKHWTRPIGIIATSLVTGITALVTSFHIPENKDKYIDTYIKMSNLTNKFEREIYKEKDNTAADELRFTYATDYTALKADLLKTKGSLSILNSSQTKPTGPNSAQPK